MYFTFCNLFSVLYVVCSYVCLSFLYSPFSTSFYGPYVAWNKPNLIWYCKGKGNVNLYSAFPRTPPTRPDMDQRVCITCKQHHICLYPTRRHHAYAWLYLGVCLARCACHHCAFFESTSLKVICCTVSKKALYSRVWTKICHENDQNLTPVHNYTCQSHNPSNIIAHVNKGIDTFKPTVAVQRSDILIMC